MFKILIIISGVALFLLLTVIVILVTLNWSEKLYSPLLSLGLAGTVTTFITVLLMLKGEVKETSFTTLIVINTQTHLPPFLDKSSTSKLNNRLSEYNFASSPTGMFNGKEETLFDVPKNYFEEKVFIEELLQYKLFKEIIEIHDHRQSVSSGGIAGIKINEHIQPKLSETDKKTSLDFAGELAKNRFSSNPMEKFEMQMLFPDLPKDTKIEFKRIPDSRSTNVENLLIVLTKPNFFTIEIIIGVSWATGPNSIPTGLEIRPEVAKLCETALFTITLKSNFEKITAGNWRTEELKNWANWMFSEIEKKYSDKVNDFG